MEALQFFQKYGDIEISHDVNPTPDVTRFERHCHARYELLYLLDGKGSFIVEGEEYSLVPHSLFLFRPYEYHYVRPASGHAYDRIVLYFEADTLPAALLHHSLLTARVGNHFSLGAAGHPIRAAFEALSGGIAALSRNGTEATPEAEALLRASITQILLLLTHEEPKPAMGNDNGTIRRVIDYLNQSLESELSLDALAREFYVSKYHLCRLFREQTGVTLFNYYNTKRMALARQLIADGKGATSVALRLGFRDYSTFYRAYKKYVGEPPKRRLRETK